MSFFKRIFRRGLSARYREGIEAYNAGDWQQALVAFRAALREGGSSSDPLVGLARFYAAEASSHLAVAALARSEPQDALRRLEPALEWNPHDANLLFLTALGYADLGDLESSARCLWTLFEEGPRHAHAHALAAALEFAGGQRDAARSHLDGAHAVREQAQGRHAARHAIVLRIVECLAPGFVELHALLHDADDDASTRRA